MADSVTIPASKDNTLFSNPEGALSSGAGPGLFVGNNSVSNTRRAVIAFDVASHLPPGATIDSAALVLNVSSAPNDTPQPIALHRLSIDWGEGTSASSGGAGAPSAPGDATWIHTFYPAQLWANPGGDFVSTPSATATIGTTGPHTWSSQQMIIDVQAWLDGTAEDHGWLLRGDETSPSTVRRLDSREHPNTQNQPYLVITYTADATPTRSTTWGELKRLYSTVQSSAGGQVQ